MGFKIFSLIFMLIIIQKSNQKVKTVVYSNFQVTFHPGFISNFTVDWSLHDNNTNEPAKFIEPITCTQIKEIPNLKAQVKVINKKTKEVGFDENFNICNYLRIRKSNIFVRMITAEIDKSVNFPIKCPFKKIVYHVNRMEVPQFNVPSFVKFNDILTTQIIFSTKIKNQIQNYLILAIDWQVVEIN